MGTLIPGVDPAIERRLERMDDATLAPVIRTILDDETATVDEYRRSRITGGVGGGRGVSLVFRISGTATTRMGERQWSVVLKILAEHSEDDPAGRPYWRREAEVYGSDLLDDLPGHLVPVRAYRIDEYPGESVWLWLEDLEDDYDGAWPLAQYRRTARHLGEFNGTFLAGRELPEESWLPEQPPPFNHYKTGTGSVIALVDRMPDDPIVRRHFPTDADRERLFSAWRERDRFRTAREELPRTFCHVDAFSRNLFATVEDGTPRTVAIDWDLCGPARVGDDPGALVFLTLAFLDWPVARADALERAVLEGYREGLAAAGWDGPTDDVLRGYRLRVVNHWLAWVNIAVKFTVDDRYHDWLADKLATPIDAALDDFRRLHRFALDVVDELEPALDDISAGTDRSRDESSSGAG